MNVAYRPGFRCQLGHNQTGYPCGCGRDPCTCSQWPNQAKDGGGLACLGTVKGPRRGERGSTHSQGSGKGRLRASRGTEGLGRGADGVTGGGGSYIPLTVGVFFF